MHEIRRRFLEPLDVLTLRGNRPFGDPGSYGESMLPPWPSVAAGALRSLVYAETGKVLDHPDEFSVLAFHIAVRHGGGRVDVFQSLPADLEVTLDDDGHARPHHLRPRTPAEGLLTSAPLAKLPVLAKDARSKPRSGYWLDAAGWSAYLEGKVPSAANLHSSDRLWKIDERVGIGLDATTRRADDGKLFSLQTVAFAQDAGFLVAFAGSALIPEEGIVRFGGDGHAVRLRAVEPSGLPKSNHAAIAAAGRARIVLTAPGLFADGWRLSGMREDGQFILDGVRARVVAAAVPRADVVSGWDLARRRPKPAERVAAIGSVYWLEDLVASPESLDKLAENGLWPAGEDNASRRVEGFNRFAFAASPD
jgi:CRISPR-associated protein Cmr3